MEKVLEEIKQINELMIAQQQALGPHAQSFAEGQCQQFLNKIKIATGMTPALATTMTSVLQQGLWTADQKQALIKAVNDQLLGDMINASTSSSSKRRANQKLYNFTAYLRQEDVAALQDPDAHLMTKLSQMCELCWKLALTMPDEPTFKHIVATTLAASGSQNLDGQTTYNLVQEFKTLIRGNGKLKHLPADNVHIEQYPPLPKELPKVLYDHVYSASPPTGIVLGNLAAVSSSVVLRKSSRSLQPHLAQSPGSFGQMQMPVQVVQQMMMMMHPMLQQGVNRPQTLPISIYAPRRSRQLLALPSGLEANPDDDDNALVTPPKQQTYPVLDIPTPSIPKTVESSTSTGVTQPDGSKGVFELPLVSALASNATWTAAEQAATLASALELRAAETAARKKEKADNAKGNVKNAKGKAKAKAKAKSTPKAKAVVKTVGKHTASTGPRPSYPKQQGGGAVHYNGGKILRSDTSSCWRVFLRATDRCDKRVLWKGNESKAWKEALDMIDSA